MTDKDGKMVASHQDIQHTFIVRYWRSKLGQPRVRVIDVQTGQAYYLEQLEQLQVLVFNLTAENNGASDVSANTG